jgi:hypothetical protein
MKKYILYRIDGNNTVYYENTNLSTGMPRETKDINLAYLFRTEETAKYYATCFINFAQHYGETVVEYQIQEIGVSEDAQDKSNFFLTVQIVDNDATGYESKVLLDVFRMPYFATFEDAKKRVRELITGTAGILCTAKIESLRDGLCSVHFVQEYSWDPCRHTSYYAQPQQ